MNLKKCAFLVDFIISNYFLFLIINLCSITTGEIQYVPVRDHTRSVFVHAGNTKPLAPWENKKYHCSNLFNYLLVHRFEESSHFLLRLCKNTAVPRICVWIFSFLFFFGSTDTFCVCTLLFCYVNGSEMQVYFLCLHSDNWPAKWFNAPV